MVRPVRPLVRVRVVDQSLDEWIAEYTRLDSALGMYIDCMPCGAQELAEPERLFSDLVYYWSAALVNNGDVFGYVHFIIEHKGDFVAIGAEGTLKAMAFLMPYYRQQQELKSDIEKGKYWWRTKDERAPTEALAEGVHEFARLLHMRRRICQRVTRHKARDLIERSASTRIATLTMATLMRCDHCDNQIKLDDDFDGKSIRCPRCKEI